MTCSSNNSICILYIWYCCNVLYTASVKTVEKQLIIPPTVKDGQLFGFNSKERFSSWFSLTDKRDVWARAFKAFTVGLELIMMNCDQANLQCSPCLIIMAQTYFHLFWYLKEFLVGKRFSINDEVKEAVKEWVSWQVAYIYELNIQKLIERQDKCLRKYGKYEHRNI